MCEIKITQISGVNPNLQSIVVQGTIEGCPPPFEGPRLIVRIICKNDVVALAAGGDIPVGDISEASDVFFGDDGTWVATFNNFSSCRCGGEITATAHCFTNSDCKDTLTVDDLQCIECPGIFISDEDVSLVPVPTCNQDGTATVTVTRFVQNNTPNPVLIRIHAGHPDGEILDGETHPFNPQTSGIISMTFRYPTLSNPQPYAEMFQFNAEPTGCAPVEIEVPTMPSCCPDIEISEITIDDCFVVVKIDPINIPEGCTYIWDFDADNPNSTQEFGDVGQRNHTYSEPGTYRIVVRVQCGTCLNSDEEIITIDKCKGKESKGCSVLRLVTAVAAAMTMLALLLATCIPGAVVPLLIAAAVFAVAGIVTGLIYFFSCDDKPCSYEILISAQATLGAGVSAMILSDCCLSVFLGAIGLITAGIALFSLWQNKCLLSFCTVAKEITKVIGGVVLPVLAVIVIIPAVNLCFSGIAMSIISGIFGLIAIYAVSCTE